MKIDVFTLDNKKEGSIELSDAVFSVAPRKDILARVVNWQLAKRRAGTHSTKTISEISGTTKKPFAQKGTGRARQGSLRSPQMRGGATIFGPVVRSHAFSLMKKVRNLGLKMALSSKVADGKLLVIDTEKISSPKTKELLLKIDNLKLLKPLFVVGATIDNNFALALKNIPNADILPSQGTNVYDILNHKNLVLTKEAVENLTNRLSK